MANHKTPTYKKNTSMIIIGIAGGSASGKTTLTKRIRETFPDTSILYHDNYYRPRTDLTLEQRENINFDHPDALETELLISHLKQLKQGKTIQCPTYDFTIHLRSEATIEVKPCKLLVVDGFLLFHWKELRELLDWKIFVDVDADIRLLRRFRRDIKERGCTVESIAEQYLANVRPMHEQFVEPTKAYADRIVKDCQNPDEWSLVKADIERLLALGG